MFVAWRDLRFARGRFLLIGSVVMLITLLVGFLGGLTQGLANANISALTSLSADQIVFPKPAAGQSLSYSNSSVTERQQAAWSAASGVTAVEPLGIATAKATGSDRAQAAVTVFGVRGSFTTVDPEQKVPHKAGSVVLSTGAASSLKALSGDRVTISGTSYEVAAVDGDAQYSHTAVVWMSLADWQRIAAVQSGGAGGAAPYATVLAVSSNGADTGAIDTAAGTTADALLPSLLKIESFKSEIGSLAMMLAMLFGISALVIGAFFTVWTIQRLGDIAVLKALGASTRSLVRDALGQALVVLVLGVGIGIGLTAVLGTLAGTALPFVVSPLTTLVPAVAMIVLGVFGAAFALRSVTRADPLTALNGQNA